MEIPRQEFIGIFNSDCANDVLYCKSEQECYDLCQHIIKKYFQPIAASSSTIVCWRYNEKTFKFKLSLLAGKFVWKNEDNPNEHIINKTQIDIPKVKKELHDLLGFNDDEDELPTTVKILVPREHARAFENFLENEKGNIFGHAEGGSVEY